MCNKGKKKILDLFVKLGVGVSAILLAGFSLQATPAAAQATAAGLSDTAVLTAIHRALPGAVPAHTGRGVASVQGQSMLSGGPARSVNMSDLPQATYLSKAGEGDHDRPLTGLTEEQYQALKRIVAKREAAGEIGAFPSSFLPVARPAEKPPSVRRNRFFVGQSQGCSLCFPSDMSLAVSENFVLQMVNNYVAVYDKHGNLQPGFPKDADTFFGLPSGTYTTDPRAFYDWDSHRFFVLELTETNKSDPKGPPNVGAIAWAVSQTPDPTRGWYVYSNNLQRASGVCPDFPTLGQDTTNWGAGATQGGIYIGLNLWSGANDCGGDTFTGNVIFILPKNPIYNGAMYGVREFDNLAIGGILVDTLQPDNVTDRADKPSSIFWTQSFNIDWGGVMCNEGCNGLGIWDISGPTTGTACPGATAGCPNNPFWFLQGGDGPLVTQKTIGTTHNYAFPPNASAPNCTAGMGGCIDADDTFISGGIKYHAGELFGSFNTGVATNPAVVGPIWFDIHPVTDNNGQLTAVEERQEDCFLCGGWANNGSAYYATLQPDQENNVIMVFDYSDDADYPGTVYTSRRVTYGDSLMDGPGNYLENGSGAVMGRWGDYSATAPDFTTASQGLLWFSSQYSIYNKGTSYWGTVIGAAEYSKSSDQ
jgi:hypothetical protein